MSTAFCISSGDHQNQDWIAPGKIHILSGLSGAELVLFASCPSGNKAKTDLAQRLLQALGRLVLRWRRAILDKSPLLSQTPLGRPTLRFGNRTGPSLSFSHDKGRLWAAISSHGMVGIDVAWPAEFAGRYPYDRAFESKELESARMLTRGNGARAAALLWSVKEAAVKAVGTGFHRHDPLHVRVESFRSGQRGMLFDIHVDGPVVAWAREEGRGWLAIATSA